MSDCYINQNENQIKDKGVKDKKKTHKLKKKSIDFNHPISMLYQKLKEAIDGHLYGTPLNKGGGGREDRWERVDGSGLYKSGFPESHIFPRTTR